ncbi:MAG: PH domain-containing protein [Acidimicrobiia bacterium]|nr:PH domain-containing protein [Acidimicrobiia bacterium]
MADEDAVTINALVPAALQLGLAAVLAVTAVMTLGQEYVYAGSDVSGAAHFMGYVFIVAAVPLALVGVANLVGRVVVDRRGVRVRTLLARREVAWDDLVGVDLDRVPFVGTAVAFRTETGDLFGTGVLRVRRRGNVFAFAEGLDRFDQDDLAGERLRRYLDSNGLFA